MIKGVQQSAAFLLVLTNGVFTRPFCRLEILTAIKARKPFITVVELDPRFNSFCFEGAATKVPAAFAPIVQRIMSDICAVPIRRDHEERQVMLRKIANMYVLGLGKVLAFTEAQIRAAMASMDTETTATKTAASIVPSTKITPTLHSTGSDTPAAMLQPLATADTGADPPSPGADLLPRLRTRRADAKAKIERLSAQVCSPVHTDTAGSTCITTRTHTQHILTHAEAAVLRTIAA